MREKYVYFQKNAAATAAIGELTFTAVDKSAKGNLVSVAIPESGTESQVTVTVSGNDITCAIGTSNDMGGDNIVTAIEASAAASALVGVVSSGSTHITSAVSQTYLSGGEAGVSFPLSSFAGMHPTDDDDLVLYFKSMKNFDGTTSGANEVVKSDSIKLKLTDGNSIREAMDDICKAFTSSKARPFDIVIGDDRGDDIQKVSSYISDVEAITIASANS
jgi:hypothetical protein